MGVGVDFEGWWHIVGGGRTSYGGGRRFRGVVAHRGGMGAQRMGVAVNLEGWWHIVGGGRTSYGGGC